MHSWILTTAVNAGGAGQRYAYPNEPGATRVIVEGCRRLEEFLEVPNRDEDGEPFHINPEHVVAIYPRED